MYRTLILSLVMALGTNGLTTGLAPLTIRGKDVVTEGDEVMSMRGMNFGGWMLMETWPPSIEME